VNVVLVVAVWLHVVATVILIGYFAVLSLFVLPVLTRALPTAELGTAIAAIERRALPFLLGCLVVFLATGVYLMGSDARYAGVGSIDSAWATILLVKHVIIVGMLGLGMYVDALAVRAGSAGDGSQAATGVRRFALGTVAMTLVGAVVLLLTAIAQGVAA
jgi:uncharacterized membrane protein